MIRENVIKQNGGPADSPGSLLFWWLGKLPGSGEPDETGEAIFDRACAMRHWPPAGGWPRGLACEGNERKRKPRRRFFGECS